MEDSTYYELLDLYKNPKHFGKLKDYDFSSSEYSASCGDQFAVYIKEEGDKIKDVSFDGEGCVVSTASLSRVCDYLIGKDLKEVNSIDIEKIKKLLGVSELSINRIGCALVGLNAIKKAVSAGKKL